MNGAILYLHFQKQGNYIFFKCLPEKVETIIITLLPNAPFSWSEELLSSELSEENRPFLLAKRQDLPYVGERAMVIQTLLQDGFEEIDALRFEQASAIYHQLSTV